MASNLWRTLRRVSSRCPMTAALVWVCNIISNTLPVNPKTTHNASRYHCPLDITINTEEMIEMSFILCLNFGIGLSCLKMLRLLSPRPFQGCCQGYHHRLVCLFIILSCFVLFCFFDSEFSFSFFFFCFCLFVSFFVFCFFVFVFLLLFLMVWASLYFCAFGYCLASAERML